MDAKHIFETLEHAGSDPQWYSGRGMMGAECLSLTGTAQEIWDAVAQVIKTAHDENVDIAYEGEDVDTDDLTIKFGDLVDSLLSDFRQDAMGYEVVVYWPKLTKPEESEDGA